MASATGSVFEFNIASIICSSRLISPEKNTLFTIILSVETCTLSIKSTSLCTQVSPKWKSEVDYRGNGTIKPLIRCRCVIS